MASTQNLINLTLVFLVPGRVQGWVDASSIVLKDQPRQCLDLEHGDTTNGKAVQIWDCNNRHTQGWVFKGDRLVYKADQSKCVDLRGGDDKNGAQIQIWDCAEDGNSVASNQEWIYESGQQRIKLKRSDGKKCVDVPSGRAWNGHDRQIWDCDHTEGQRWALASEDLTGSDVGYIVGVVMVSVALAVSLAVNGYLVFKARGKAPPAHSNSSDITDVIGSPVEERPAQEDKSSPKV